jgi:hypothetical protein
MLNKYKDEKAPDVVKVYFSTTEYRRNVMIATITPSAESEGPMKKREDQSKIKICRVADQKSAHKSQINSDFVHQLS